MSLDTNLISILLIENDELDIVSIQAEFHRLLSATVPEAIFHFTIARNGVDALNKLYGKNGETMMLIPKVILLDIRMPKMNGITFLNEIKKDKSFDNIHIYLVTALYGTDDKIATRNLKIEGRIIKPLQHDDVLRVYMNAIGL